MTLVMSLHITVIIVVNQGPCLGWLDICTKFDKLTTIQLGHIFLWNKKGINSMEQPNLGIY